MRNLQCTITDMRKKVFAEVKYAMDNGGRISMETADNRFNFAAFTRKITKEIHVGGRFRRGICLA